MKEDDFLHELEVFGTEVQGCIKFFYAYLAINDVPADNKKGLNIINRTPLLWRTIRDALETSFFITLARIFDKDKRTHNIRRLLNIAQSNIDIFSAKALKNRKIKSSANAHEWIDDYMRDIYIPKPNDFEKLDKHVNKYNAIWKTYSKIRHQIFAHKERLNEIYINKLYLQTNIREVQKLLVFLLRLYEALCQLFHDGRKPILRPMRYSVKSMRKTPLPEGHIGTVQEIIVKQTQGFFDLFSFIPDRYST